MWNKRLTCNQLMILCSLYRGTEIEEFKPDTYPKDIEYLINIGFVNSKGGLSNKGNNRVRSALGIFPAEDAKKSVKTGTFDVES